MSDGRVKDGGNGSERKYQIKVLWDRHREILRLRLLGHKADDIAMILGLTVPVIHYTINSALGRRHLSLMRAARDVECIDVAKEIDKMVPKAVKIFNNILEEGQNSTSPSVLQAKVAGEVIERKVPKVIRTESYHAHFTADEIDDIKNRAKNAGTVVEGEFEELAADGP